jgi:hypothetical protein
VLNRITRVKVFLEVPIDVAGVEFLVVVYGSFGVQIHFIEDGIAVK